MKPNFFILFAIFLLFTPLVIAAECPAGFVCDDARVEVNINGEDSDKVPNPENNWVTRTVIAVLVILFLAVAFYFNKKIKKRRAEKKEGLGKKQESNKRKKPKKIRKKK